MCVLKGMNKGLSWLKFYCVAIPAKGNSITWNSKLLLICLCLDFCLCIKQPDLLHSQNLCDNYLINDTLSMRQMGSLTAVPFCQCKYTESLGQHLVMQSCQNIYFYFVTGNWRCLLSISICNGATSLSKLSSRLSRLLLRLPALRLMSAAITEELFFAGLIGNVQIDSIIPYILRMETADYNSQIIGQAV